jgi:hypothetical protein
VLKQVTEQEENGCQSLAFVLEVRQGTSSLAEAVLLVTRSCTLIGLSTSTDLRQKISFSALPKLVMAPNNRRCQSQRDRRWCRSQRRTGRLRSGKKIFSQKYGLESISMIMYRSQLKDIADRQVWVFGVENMRNTYLKDVRKQWEDSKVLFGRTKVMAKALGTTQEDEYQVNLHKLSKVSFVDGVD